MPRPNMVLRKSIPVNQLQTIEHNIMDLDNWPMWNKFANRILSESHGKLKVRQRIDLHRVVAQQLIEDMWIIAEINEGVDPRFCQIIINWQGQKVNGRTSALAIKTLTLDITLLHNEDGGVEVTAWWEISRLSRILGFGNRIARRIVKQIFDDLTTHGVIDYHLEHDVKIKQTE